MAEAAHTYKRLLATVPIDSDGRARAGWRLARTYEARKLYLSARDTYLDLLARFPHERVPDTDSGRTLADVVTAELARSPYSLTGRRSSPASDSGAAVPPLALAASRQPGNPCPLRPWRRPVAGREPAASWSSKTGCGCSTRGRARRDGRPSWGFRYVWAGYSPTSSSWRSAREIVALELAQGAVQWRYGRALAGKDPGRPDPFASPKADERNDSGQRFRDELHDLQLVKGRRLLSARPARADRPRRRYRRRRLVVFVAARGDQSQSLDRCRSDRCSRSTSPISCWCSGPTTASRLARHSLGENELLERPPMPVDEDSVLLVSDRRTVKKFDVNHGQTVVGLPGKPRTCRSTGRRASSATPSACWSCTTAGCSIRLDPATGSKRWSCPLGIEDLSERPGSMAYDDKRFYCVNTGRHLGSGSDRPSRWTTAPPSGRRHLTGPEDAAWSIALTERHVIAYPSTDPTSSRSKCRS